MPRRTSGVRKDWLFRYFREIDKIPVLSSKQEVDLIRLIRGGDAIAFNKLVRSNLKFVVKIALQYRNSGLPLEDLINEGNCGLIKAIDHFDETLGYKFISYAVWWIRQSILRSLSEHSRVVRLPVNRIGEIQKVARTVLKLEQQFEREPQLEEVASALNFSKEQVSDALLISRASLSFEAPHPQNDDVCLGDMIQSRIDDSPDSGLLKNSLKTKIFDLLDTLTDRQATVIKLYYGLDRELPQTLEEIGLQLKISRERVRQIKEKAISRLRHISRSRVLREYID
ncbi:sigma-70 family RNA polymerase sigma factor [candidate division KSB1 bacterium]|nr:sigma-70 family RNA polymerase sigma factor [candidate division KSB1 bacterium]